MDDLVMEGFLREQYEKGMAFAAQSDLVELYPVIGPQDPLELLRRLVEGRPPKLDYDPNSGADPPDRYHVHFRCKGLVRQPGGEIVEASHFMVEVWFPPDYLRVVEPLEVVTWIGPRQVFHPNIRPSLICMGHIAPATDLVTILYQLYEIISYHNWAAHDALNAEASQWARNQPQGRFPVDRRPLKRRALPLTVNPTPSEKAP